MELFDTHCHLTDSPLAQDLDGVLQRAADAGVGRFMVPGYDISSSRAACRLAKTYPVIKAAIGLHPAWIDPTHIKLSLIHI